MQVTTDLSKRSNSTANPSERSNRFSAHSLDATDCMETQFDGNRLRGRCVINQMTADLSKSPNSTTDAWVRSNHVLTRSLDVTECGRTYFEREESATIFALQFTEVEIVFALEIPEG